MDFDCTVHPVETNNFSEIFPLYGTGQTDSSSGLVPKKTFVFPVIIVQFQTNIDRKYRPLPTNGIEPDILYRLNANF